MTDQIIVVNSGIPGPTGATGASGAGADSLNDLSSFRSIYVGSDGDDANDGLSFANRVQTWGAASALLVPGQHNQVWVSTDLDIDYAQIIYRPNFSVQIAGRNSDNTAYLQRKLTIKDSTNVSGRCGGMVCHGNMSFFFFYIDVELATADTYAFLDARFGNVTGRVDTCTLTRTGSGSAAFFGAYDGAFLGLTFTNFTLTATGYLEQSVASGTDPNARYNITSNLTSG